MFKQFTNLRLTCPPSPFWFREDQNYMLFPGNALQVDTTEIKLEKRDYTRTPDGFFIFFIFFIKIYVCNPNKLEREKRRHDLCRLCLSFI